MSIDFDYFSFPGAVRIRANAPDPFAGLRGRAYISARKLDQRPLEKIVSQADAEAKNESRENLIKAINKTPAKAGVNERLVVLCNPSGPSIFRRRSLGDGRSRLLLVEENDHFPEE